MTVEEVLNLVQDKYPIEVHSSLHIEEEVYSINEDIYQLYYAIDGRDEGVPIIKVNGKIIN